MKGFKFELNDELKDVVTGFRGVCTQRTDYLTGCNRYGLTSGKRNEKGELAPSVTFDENQLVHVKSDATPIRYVDKDFKFECGDLVKDMLSDIDGIVVARSDYMVDNPKYALLPQKLVNGQPVDWQCFAEGSLTLVKAGKIILEPEQKKQKVSTRVKGGPSMTPSTTSMSKKAGTL